MSVQYPFFASASPFLRQPATTKIVVRSSSVSDTGKTFTLTGIDEGAPTALSSAFPAHGLGIRVGESEWTFLSSFALGSACVGDVSILSGGTPAAAAQTVLSLPDPGESFTCGAGASTITLTARLGAAATFLMPAQSGNIVQGEYFDFIVSSVTKRFWFSIDGILTGAPAAPALGELILVSIATGALAPAVAAAVVAATANALPRSAVGATVTIGHFVLGAQTLSFVDAITGVITYTVLSTGTSPTANTFRALYNSNGTVMTTAQFLASFLEAVNGLNNDSAFHNCAGSLVLSASAAGPNSFLLTARVPAYSPIAWTVSQTGDWIETSLPQGGADGLLLALLPAGGLAIFQDFSLQSGDFTTTLTLPARFTGSSQSMPIGGSPVRLEVSASDVVSNLTLKYQTSSDGVNWRDGSTTIASVDNNPLTLPLGTNCAEAGIEAIRLVVVTNANVAPAALNVAVISR